MLKQHGIEPAPNRKRTTSWSTFLKAHWDVLGAIDFTTVEVWTKGGLVTFYLLFVMELKTRRVHFAGCTTSPHEIWMKQIARELTNCDDSFLSRAAQPMLMNWKPSFQRAFDPVELAALTGWLTANGDFTDYRSKPTASDTAATSEFGQLVTGSGIGSAEFPPTRAR